MKLQQRGKRDEIKCRVIIVNKKPNSNYTCERKLEKKNLNKLLAPTSTKN